MDVFFVDVDAALLAGEDEVEVQAEADPGVEGDPGEDEVELGFREEEEGERCPVHEPGGEDGGVGGAEGFIGGEDGEEDGGYRAGSMCVSDGVDLGGWGRAHVRMSAMKLNMVMVV